MLNNEKLLYSIRSKHNMSAYSKYFKVLVFLFGLSSLISLGGGCTPALVTSAARNDVVEVKSLIDRGVDINATGLYKTFASDYTYMTAIHAAAYEGHNDVAEILVKAGADVDVKTPNTMITPLYMACRKGHIDVVRTLLAHNAKIDERSYKGFTALCTASANGYTEIVRALLEEGAAVNLSSSYQQNRYRPVRTFTPLYIACESGHVEVVNLLLRYGAEINKGSHKDSTPLHIASLNGHNDVINILLNEGADINAKNKDGETPLHWASRRGRAATVELLISKGANQEAKNKKGKIPSEVSIVTASDARARSAIVAILRLFVSIVQIGLSMNP